MIPIKSYPLTDILNQLRNDPTALALQFVRVPCSAHFLGIRPAGDLALDYLVRSDEVSPLRRPVYASLSAELPDDFYTEWSGMVPGETSGTYIHVFVGFVILNDEEHPND